MNKFLANLLLVFSLGLCALCSFQWVREGKLYQQINKLNEDVYKGKETIQGLEGTIKHDETEITRLDGVKNDLIQTVATNKQEIASLTKYSDKLEKEETSLRQQIESYKEAMQKANDSITRQNNDIRKQNELMKTLAAQRDEKVAELNAMIEKYNKVVTDFNKLQEDVDKQREAAENKDKEKDKKKP